MEDDKVLANNNPTNLKSYRDFMREQNARYSQIEKKIKNVRSVENLKEWNVMLKWPWNQADIDFFQGRPKTQAEEAIATGRLNSFVILGGVNRGKSFYTHALVKEFIKNGLLTPSEIRWTSIREGAENINGMFKSREWKDKFFHKDAKLLVVEGCSRDFTMLGHKDNDRFWNELNEFVKEGNRYVIINYSLSSDEETQETILPIISAKKEISFKMVKGSTFVLVSSNTQNPNRKITKE